MLFALTTVSYEYWGNPCSMARDIGTFRRFVWNATDPESIHSTGANASFLEIQTPRHFWAFWVMGTIGGKLGVLERTAGKLARRPASNVLLAVWEDI